MGQTRLASLGTAGRKSDTTNRSDWIKKDIVFTIKADDFSGAGPHSLNVNLPTGSLVTHAMVNVEVGATGTTPQLTLSRPGGDIFAALPVSSVMVTGPTLGEPAPAGAFPTTMAPEALTATFGSADVADLECEVLVEVKFPNALS